MLLSFPTLANQLSKAEFVFADSICILYAYSRSSQQHLWLDYKSEVLTHVFLLLNM